MSKCFGVFALFIYLSCFSKQHSAPTMTSTSADISCDFDADLCGYELNEFMERYTGESPSLTSGPTGDKTTGEEGYYILCNGKLLRNEADKCTLSKYVSVEQEQTLDFWYFMYGTQIGTLELIVDNETVLWSLTGKQKNEWLMAQVKLPIGDYYLQFAANRSTDGRLSSDIAIDDIMIESQPLTTMFITPTRTSARPINFPISATGFDKYDDLSGWHTDYSNNRWLQTSGNLSNAFGYYGPASDFNSISAITFNITNLISTRIKCAIPYCDVNKTPQYYCRKLSLKKDLMCGFNLCPQVIDVSSYGKCDLGYYMMITNDKFETQAAQFRSRFISPVYSLPSTSTSFCLTFQYNVYTDSDDGFKLVIENYLTPSESATLFQIYRSLPIDKWYMAKIQIFNLPYTQFRFFFEPRRAEIKNLYASVSIDSILLEINNCDDEYTTFDFLPTTTSSIIISSSTSESYETISEMTSQEDQQSTQQTQTSTNEPNKTTAELTTQEDSTTHSTQSSTKVSSVETMQSTVLLSTTTIEDDITSTIFDMTILTERTQEPTTSPFISLSTRSEQTLSSALMTLITSSISNEPTTAKSTTTKKATTTKKITTTSLLTSTERPPIKEEEDDKSNKITLIVVLCLVSTFVIASLAVIFFLKKKGCNSKLIQINDKNYLFNKVESTLTELDKVNGD